MLIARAWDSLVQLIIGIPLQTPLTATGPASSPFAFVPTWRVLGPFQLGTREAVWGADPLAQFGGFGSLEYNATTTFRSSLATNGTISWSTHTAKLVNSDPWHAFASAELTVGFPEIEWESLRDVYGWAAVQWQAWARGEIHVQSDETETFTLDIPGLLEFWIDGIHYFGGDFYSYKRAPVVLHLDPGIHRIDIRLVRDVRSMGGFGELTVQANISLRKRLGPLKCQNSILISDFVGEPGSTYVPASPYMSATLFNNGLSAIEVFDAEPTHDLCIGELLSPVRILPGQSRPVALRFKCVGPSANLTSYYVKLAVNYRIEGEDFDWQLELGVNAYVRSPREPHKVTFMHPAGIVSYAILRPPSHNSEEAPRNISVPILIVLHGAGVEADDQMVNHALDPLPDLPAWVLYPTGGTSWSGDDWHAWGLADVEAAVKMIPDWIHHLDWKGYDVSVDEWLVTGHSNGGQGAWYILTHRPDKVIAAAALSGYSSIQNYVPYTLWQPADPGRTAIVQAALSNYRHELLLSNAKGIPVLQQHGSLDDNVPPYNSRLMSQLIRENGANSEYFEMPGQPHFWDGCITTEPLKDFYERQLTLNRSSPRSVPHLNEFSVVTTNPGDTGPKNGVKIDELFVPGQIGRVDVVFNSSTLTCTFWTSNVRRFSLPYRFNECNSITINDQAVEAPESNTSITAIYQDSKWTTTKENQDGFEPRQGRQLAAMDAVLRTHGPFQIVTANASSSNNHIALQISHNLNQYYAADTVITQDYTSALSATGNIINISSGNTTNNQSKTPHPIQIHPDSSITVRGPNSHNYTYTNSRNRGLAATYLSPLPNERLELIIWGLDAESLSAAARLVPLIPGSGQPDFIILDKTTLWKGIEGTLAMGFLDTEWEVSRNSFFT